MAQLFTVVRYSARLVAVLVVVLVVQGCAETVPLVRNAATHLNPAAYDDLGRALGRSIDDMQLTEGTLDDIAREADVASGQVSAVATQHAPPAVVVDTTRTLDEEFGEFGESVLKDATIDLSCDVLDGEEVTWEDVAVALGEAVSAQPTPRAKQVGDATQKLVGKLQAARESPDPDERTAVAVLCYVAGLG
ncbi:MAG: hypothetical protein JWR45_1045 [Blastococcus sp.]|jgi:hypothetical protein|nr:hypothetical protein [Blastococcus sp.]